MDRLESELSSQQFNTWIRPLQSIETSDSIRLLAPNQFVLNWVKNNHLGQITNIVNEISGDKYRLVHLEIGTRAKEKKSAFQPATNNIYAQNSFSPNTAQDRVELPMFSNLNSDFTFDTFVEGKSNQLARAASVQIGENPGTAYNPLFIYGGVGLGKTHLMHAVGNMILANNPSSKVIYLHLKVSWLRW